jgi:hypothetical protein
MRSTIARRLCTLFDSPFADRLQLLPRRRLVAFAVLVWQPVLVSLLFLVWQDAILPLLLAVVVQLALVLMLSMVTRGMYEWPMCDMRLDERQTAQRDADFRKAYYFGLVWLLAVTPFYMLVEEFEEVTEYLLAFTMLGFLWGALAPQVLYAWSAPVESFEED